MKFVLVPNRKGIASTKFNQIKQEINEPIIKF